jgi:hypothetical protein
MAAPSSHPSAAASSTWAGRDKIASFPSQSWRRDESFRRAGASSSEGSGPFPPRKTKEKERRTPCTTEPGTLRWRTPPSTSLTALELPPERGIFEPRTANKVWYNANLFCRRLHSATDLPDPVAVLLDPALDAVKDGRHDAFEAVESVRDLEHGLGRGQVGADQRHLVHLKVSLVRGVAIEI